MFVDNMILFLIDERKVIMIVIKRDGQEVNYNRSKIIVAIGKANEEVPEEEEGISARMINQEAKKVPQEDRVVPEENELEVSEAGHPHLGHPHPGPRPPRPPHPAPGIPYDPFNDGQFTDCRKIKPSDCGTLCRKNGCFCNNRFVMYGYQNFGHLLLCRNHRGQYILGVPGSYSQQERFMANMFGFPYFRESPEIHIPGGKGGYWYCFINS